MKLFWLSLVAFVFLPLPLHAQQPATANPITETFRGFGYYGNWLMMAFDSIPASKYGFKPTPAQQSVGYIAQHLEDANYALCQRFSGLARPMTARDSLADTIKAAWPKDTLVARLRASFFFCRDAINRVEDAKLTQPIPVGPADSGRNTTPIRDLILFITDLADHYSQIANYMRLLGLTPPSALQRTGR